MSPDTESCCELLILLINSSGQPTKDGFGGRLTSSYFKEMLNRWAGTEASSELL
jgi:hypothetical protein